MKTPRKLRTIDRCRLCRALVVFSDAWKDPEELRLFRICASARHFDFMHAPAFRYHHDKE